MGRFQNRSEPVAMTKAAGTTRIIAVGGSTTLNRRAFAMSGQDYPRSVEKLLNEATGDTHEVLNAGAEAYSTAQSLINIQFRLIEFDPDVIVLMHNVNDASVNVFGDQVAPDYGNKYISEFYLNPQLQGGRSLFGLLNQSRLLSGLRLPQLLMSRNTIDPERDFGPGLALFERNLEHIATICEAQGITLVLLSQPSLNEGFKYGVTLASFERYNEAIRAVADAQGVAFVDMYEAVGHDDRFFLDSVHYSPEGITRFAEVLAPELRRILSARRAQPHPGAR